MALSINSVILRVYMYCWVGEGLHTPQTFCFEMHKATIQFKQYLFREK